LAGDLADRTAARTHHHRLGRRAAGAEAYAFHQLAVGDTGRDEEAVVGAYQIIGGEYAVQIVSAGYRALAFLVVAWRQTPLDQAAHALHRAGGDDALRSAADTDQQIDTGVRARREDGAGDVAVGDELDPGAALADIGD